MIQHTCTGQRSNLGRFARPGNVAAWDRYADVRNNPLRYTDPSGHDPQPIPQFCTSDNECIRVPRIPTRAFYLRKPLNTIKSTDGGYEYNQPTGSWNHPGVDYSIGDSRVYAVGRGVVLIARTCEGLTSNCTKEEVLAKHQRLNAISNNYGYGILVVIAYPIQGLPSSLAADLLAVEPNARYMIIVTSHYRLILVQEKQVVVSDTLLGFGGSTGNSSGPHLHFEVRISDRLKFGAACGKYSCANINWFQGLPHVNPEILEKYYREYSGGQILNTVNVPQ